MIAPGWYHHSSSPSLRNPFGVSKSALEQAIAPRAPLMTAPNTVKCVVPQMKLSPEPSKSSIWSVRHSFVSSSNQPQTMSSVLFSTASVTWIGSVKSEILISCPESSTSRMLTGVEASFVCSSAGVSSLASGWNDANKLSLMAVTSTTALPSTPVNSESAAAGMDAETVLPDAVVTATSAGSPEAMRASVSTTAADVTPDSDWMSSTTAMDWFSASPPAASKSARRLVKTASSAASRASFTMVTSIVVVVVVVVVVGPGGSATEAVETVDLVVVVVVSVEVDDEELVLVLEVRNV
mmetsp:Transcript_40812/g.95835  ORF Transcript_40812/g.95835 Transcript_40812/m.95835 type:complete len:295 (+) Transcript_40812:83-967(+)